MRALRVRLEVLFESVADPGTCPMQQHSLMGVGEPKNVTNLGCREPVEIAEHQHFTLCGRQRFDGVPTILEPFGWHPRAQQYTVLR